MFFSPLVIRYLSLFPLLLLVELSNYLTLVDAFPIFLTRPLSVIRDKLCVCISCTCNQPCLTLEIRGICPCLPEFETASMLLLMLKILGPRIHDSSCCYFSCSKTKREKLARLTHMHKGVIWECQGEQHHVNYFTKSHFTGYWCAASSCPLHVAHGNHATLQPCQSSVCYLRPASRGEDTKWVRVICWGETGSQSVDRGDMCVCAH